MDETQQEPDPENVAPEEVDLNEQNAATMEMEGQHHMQPTGNLLSLADHVDPDDPILLREPVQ